jgi:hypothetical protein
MIFDRFNHFFENKFKTYWTIKEVSVYKFGIWVFQEIGLGKSGFQQIKYKSLRFCPVFFEMFQITSIFSLLKFL